MDVRSITGDDFKECWNVVLKLYAQQVGGEEFMQMLVFGLWRLWEARNDVVFNEARPQPEVVVQLMMQQWSEFNDATRVARVQSVGATLRLNMEAAGVDVMHGMGWRSPYQNVSKLNCDGTWCSKSNTGGWCWVVRSWPEMFKVVGGAGGFHCMPSTMAEAEAVRARLQACVEKRFEMVDVETYAKAVVDMLETGKISEVSVEGIIHDIRVLPSHLRSVVFKFSLRKCNIAAHKVAAYIFKEKRVYQ